jgi:hypothetical protein
MGERLPSLSDCNPALTMPLGVHRWRNSSNNFRGGLLVTSKQHGSCYLTQRRESTPMRASSRPSPRASSCRSARLHLTTSRRLASVPSPMQVSVSSQVLSKPPVPRACRACRATGREHSSTSRWGGLLRQAGSVSGWATAESRSVCRCTSRSGSASFSSSTSRSSARTQCFERRPAPSPCSGGHFQKLHQVDPQLKCCGEMMAAHLGSSKGARAG